MSEAEKALRNILEYIGGLDEYINNAQLITYIERAIEREAKPWPDSSSARGCICRHVQGGASLLLIEDRIILDLCGGTGSWSRPYADAGYDVRVIDPKVTGQDVRLIHKPSKQIHGILAAPPCTVFASSGARWPRSDEDYIRGLSIVDACLRLVVTTQPQFWVLENPVGKLVRWLGKPRMYFQPCDYGDPYTKRTCLWGEFNEPGQAPVKPLEGSKMHLQYGGKSDKTKTMRSITPPGFAQAFFEANR